MMCINLVVCGDGKVTGDEQCDDAKNPHGCLDDCSSGRSRTATYAASRASRACRSRSRVCGDGALDPGEQCDDGDNTVAGDGCSSTCTVDTGWVTAARPRAQKCLPARSLRQRRAHSPDEECDDGNAVDGDGCSTSAASVASASPRPSAKSNPAGQSARRPGKPCIPKCGDGVKKGFPKDRARTATPSRATAVAPLV